MAPERRVDQDARAAAERRSDSLDADPPPARIGRLFPVSKQLLRQDWEAAREAIGRPDLLFKDLRHTFAQSLEDAGAGDMITDALHHSDPRLRRRYAKARIDAMRKRLDRLGRRQA